MAHRNFVLGAPEVYRARPALKTQQIKAHPCCGLGGGVSYHVHVSEASGKGVCVPRENEEGYSPSATLCISIVG